jgi:putative hemolysin
VRLNGVIEAEQQQMPTGVLRLAFRSAYALITPRRDVETVNSGASLRETPDDIRKSGRPRLPLRNPETEGVVGVAPPAAAYRSGDSGRVSIRSDQSE